MFDIIIIVSFVIFMTFSKSCHGNNHMVLSFVLTPCSVSKQCSTSVNNVQEFAVNALILPQILRDLFGIIQFFVRTILTWEDRTILL